MTGKNVSKEEIQQKKACLALNKEKLNNLLDVADNLAQMRLEFCNLTDLSPEKWDDRIYYIIEIILETKKRIDELESFIEKYDNND